MQHRLPCVLYRVLFLLLGLISVVSLHNGELRAEERFSSAVAPTPPLAEALGVTFLEGSTSSVILERDGKQYVVDVASRTIRENDPTVRPASTLTEPQPTAPLPAQTAGAGSTIFQQNCVSCHGTDGKGIAASKTPDLTNFRARSGIPSQRIIDVITNGKSGTGMQGFSGRLSPQQINDVASFVQSLSNQPAQSKIYEAPDDLVYSLPTGRRLARGGLYLNFTHRFAYNPAFSGAGLGNILSGLDGFALASFGLRYGVTDKISVSVYRSPSAINRPIEFMGAYNLLDEHDGHPINAAVRISIDGQDNFRRNFTTNLEGIFSRSITNRAQLYAVPTLSFNNRRLVSKPGPLQNRPEEVDGINTLSIGAGLAFNIRPTLAIVTEVIPTVVNGSNESDVDLGIHRPAYAFGIQKTVRGHAFTFGVSNGPGTVVAQRAGTRASYLNDPTADKPSGLFFGFNLMRRLR